MLRDLKLLVVEDNEEDFDMICHGLKKLGLKNNVVHLTDTEAACRWLEANNEKAAFVLLDLNIPGEGGMSLIKKFKNHPQLNLVPLVVLTTSTNPNDILNSYRAGASAFHVKPLETPVFHETVQRIATYWLCDAVTIMAGA